MKIHFDETRPIYLQIIEEIKREIAKGNLRAGDKLPSVRDLAREIEVNPNTVARAYLELEREGVLVSKRGQGTFITEEKQVINRVRKELKEEILKKVLRELKSLGISLDEIMSFLKKSMEEGK
jgi:GntR family transcriptional regulator